MNALFYLVGVLGVVIVIGGGYIYDLLKRISTQLEAITEGIRKLGDEIGSFYLQGRRSPPEP